MSMYDVFDELMKSRKMNPTEVSRQTKIPRSMFTDWKNGRSTPKADKLKILADFFGVSVDVFYDDDVKVQNSGQQKVYYENAETAQLDKRGEENGGLYNNGLTIRFLGEGATVGVTVGIKKGEVCASLFSSNHSFIFLTEPQAQPPKFSVHRQSCHLLHLFDRRHGLVAVHAINNQVGI